MNVVDSSAWIEFLNAGPNGPSFRPIVQDAKALIVPTIVIYEVFKQTLRRHGSKEAQSVAVAMQQGRVADIDANLAMSAARISVEHDLAMADSLILATTRACGATLWTQDDDFEGLPNVRYFVKSTPEGRV